MQQEIRFATFNVCNLAPAGAKLYDNLPLSTQAEYDAKVGWTARQLDLLDADVIGFQEIFSQAVLKDVLARTRLYRDAVHVGFDPDAAAERLTPSVALVSRLPLVGAPVLHTRFPEGVALPPGTREPDRYARAVLQACVEVSPDCKVDVLVLHLKSKRPDYRSGDSGDDPQLYALACLRSLMRRGTEAVALRALLSTMARERKLPRVVLGDFNDVADAVTTSIVIGAGAPLGDRMFDAFQLQAGERSGFSVLHEGHYSTIDHILVSEEFNPALPNAIGEVLDVRYLSDHLVLALPEASDHGQVIARLRLFDEAHGFMDGGV
jgi:endonuclease/exonuclease/phosphatase family metal-dependent hydrolase